VPLNQIIADVTVNASGQLSIAGIDNKVIPLGQIDSQAVAIAKNLDNVHLVLQGDVVTVDVHGIPLAKMQSTQASRQVVENLAVRYGVQLSPEVQARLEQWLSSSNLDITVRYANEPSKPLKVNVAQPVLVDVGSDGRVTVENIPLDPSAVRLDPLTVQTLGQGIQNAVICWKKGTLNAKVDGKSLPPITVDPNGARVLSQVFGLGIENDIGPIFDSLIGLDVDLPGGKHQAGSVCGNE